KPAPAFFAAALAHLDASAAGTLMVGDDVENDVLAAQRQGLTGALVKTGKYLPRALQNASGTPDYLLGSFADVPELLDKLSEAAGPAQDHRGGWVPGRPARKGGRASRRDRDLRGGGPLGRAGGGA